MKPKTAKKSTRPALSKTFYKENTNTNANTTGNRSPVVSESEKVYEDNDQTHPSTSSQIQFGPTTQESLKNKKTVLSPSAPVIHASQISVLPQFVPKTASSTNTTPCSSRSKHLIITI